MTHPSKGKTIRLFLVDGTPQSILTAEIINWTGHVISAPRTKLTELIQRPEMPRTGIYFLTGPAPDSAGKTMVYIGESDNVGKRLVQHNKDDTKDFWEKACVITSKDQNLTKAHARYLESRLISIAKNAGHAKLFNGTAPDYGFLPEADIADMEYFISQVRLVMPVLGLDFLRERPQIRKEEAAEVIEAETLSDNKIISRASPTPRVRVDKSPVFEIDSTKLGIRAQAQEAEGDFIVFSGSQSQIGWIGERSHSYEQLHKNLVEEGKITPDPDSAERGVFQEDVAFSSPSAASAVVFGRSSNGRREWKVKGTSKTYEDWQNEQLLKVQGEAA